MPPEAMAEAQEWLNRAERDLRTSALLLRGPEVLPDESVFHAQQAAEKALKAYLASRDEPFAKTHDLPRLVKQCQTLDEEFAQLADAASVLNPYVSQFRYPGGPLEPEISVAETALELAAGILQFVRARL